MADTACSTGLSCHGRRDKTRCRNLGLSVEPPPALPADQRQLGATAQGVFLAVRWIFREEQLDAHVHAALAVLRDRWCERTVSLDPRAMREQRAEALEGWTLMLGQVHCPEHSGDPPWIPNAASPTVTSDGATISRTPRPTAGSARRRRCVVLPLRCERAAALGSGPLDENPRSVSPMAGASTLASDSPERGGHLGGRLKLAKRSWVSR